MRTESIAKLTNHTPGPEATETSAQICMVCGYQIAPKLEVKETEPPTTQEDGEHEGEFLSWFAAGVILLMVGTVAVNYWRKRH